MNLPKSESKNYRTIESNKNEILLQMAEKLPQQRSWQLFILASSSELIRSFECFMEWKPLNVFQKLFGKYLRMNGHFHVSIFDKLNLLKMVEITQLLIRVPGHICKILRVWCIICFKLLHRSMKSRTGIPNMG